MFVVYDLFFPLRKGGERSGEERGGEERRDGVEKRWKRGKGRGEADNRGHSCGRSSKSFSSPVGREAEEKLHIRGDH